MPARAAPVCAMLGKPLRMSAAMLTIEPPCFSIDWVKTSRLTMKPPVRLLRTTDVEALGAHGGGGRGELAAGIVEQAMDAAVAGRRSSAIASLTCASSRMSKAWVSQRAAGRFDLAPARVASLSGLRPVITTCAPSAAISCAVQRPMPLPPPVTRWSGPQTAPA